MYREAAQYVLPFLRPVAADSTSLQCNTHLTSLGRSRFDATQSSTVLYNLPVGQALRMPDEQRSIGSNWLSALADKLLKNNSKSPH